MTIDNDKQTQTTDDGSEQLQSIEITIPDETGDKTVETGDGRTSSKPHRRARNPSQDDSSSASTR